MRPRASDLIAPSSVFLGGLGLVVLVGCGALSRLVPSTDPSPSTTAVRPAAASLALSVTPGNAPAGTSFHLRLTGLLPTDVVTFSILAQGGRPYTGPTHTPDASGAVQAVYETAQSDRVGLYVVLAHTATGRAVYGTFHVEPPTAASAPS